MHRWNKINYISILSVSLTDFSMHPINVTIILVHFSRSHGFIIATGGIIKDTRSLLYRILLNVCTHAFLCMSWHIMLVATYVSGTDRFRPTRFPIPFTLIHSFPRRFTVQSNLLLTLRFTYNFFVIIGYLISWLTFWNCTQLSIGSRKINRNLHRI